MTRMSDPRRWRCRARARLTKRSVAEPSSGRDEAVGAVRPEALSTLLKELFANGDDAGERAWGRALRPGAVVDRFELVREIGRGGFGIVYEARDLELGRSVAFKALRPGGLPDARDERLLREAEAAARLAHPNIITIHDVGRTESGPYLILELLQGQTLARRLQLGPLPTREALRIAVAIAEGLAHAHTHGVRPS
jgi:eukaryotic-like serine/threonine-protein kinase